MLRSWLMTIALILILLGRGGVNAAETAMTTELAVKLHETLDTVVAAEPDDNTKKNPPVKPGKIKHARYSLLGEGFLGIYSLGKE